MVTQSNDHCSNVPICFSNIKFLMDLYKYYLSISGCGGRYLAAEDFTPNYYQLWQSYYAIQLVGQHI